MAKLNLMKLYNNIWTIISSGISLAVTTSLANPLFSKPINFAIDLALKWLKPKVDKKIADIIAVKDKKLAKTLAKELKDAKDKKQTIKAIKDAFDNLP